MKKKPYILIGLTSKFARTSFEITYFVSNRWNLSLNVFLAIGHLPF